MISGSSMLATIFTALPQRLQIVISILSNHFYRYFLNPVMRSLLRSPLHGITSHNIGIVHFSGRKSGRKLSTPLSYTQEGNIVRLLSSRNTQVVAELPRGGSRG